MNDNGGEIRICEADPGMLRNLSELFHQYRLFYGYADEQPQREAALDFIRERLERRDSVLLAAVVEDELAGFVQLYPVFSSLSMKRSWILNDLYVDRRWRGRGTARQLLHEAERHARSTGAAYIQLSTAPDNMAARRLYESEGYEQDTEFLTYELRLR
ncbi:GNAT family N-acetyltransferase [Paenibacillus pasadenensis]|uniref:GNAT family N-acetyltransferase n=1 Tax=Paenibacillus pasadenensis TaxID=217090 RepID=UPI00203EE4AB|nr:GNAT family N-acetyltransferase [Paenibacillus pasadenensis]MCM3746832.1 GNAT family N-acetyltransferase [Paenibacillus pasadenensis]